MSGLSLQELNVPLPRLICRSEACGPSTPLAFSDKGFFESLLLLFTFIHAPCCWLDRVLRCSPSSSKIVYASYVNPPLLDTFLLLECSLPNFTLRVSLNLVRPLSLQVSVRLSLTLSLLFTFPSSLALSCDLSFSLSLSLSLSLFLSVSLSLFLSLSLCIRTP